MSELKLGKNQRTVNTEQIQGGIKREDLKNETQKRIFDAFNKFSGGGQLENEVLDAEEVQNIIDQLVEQSGDDLKLGRRDAKKIFKALNLKGLKKEDLFNFIEQLSQSSKNIKSSDVLVGENGERTVLVTREIEQNNNDGTTQIITTDEQTNPDGKTQINSIATKVLNENKKMLSNTIVTDDYTEETLYTDENGNVVLNDKGEEVPTKTTAKNKTQTAITNYIDGKPATANVKQGNSIEEEYKYIDGEPYLMSRTENKGLPVEKTTSYMYGKDGTLTETVTGNGKIEITDYAADRKTVLSKHITVGSNITEITYNEDGTFEEFSYNSSVESTVTGNSDNKRLSQKKVVNGKEYNLEYDGAGNTKGIIVQNGETIQKIADKFGCSVEKLLDVNEALGKGKNKYFSVGQEIKIPKELEADDKALQGRDSKEAVIAKYNAQQKALREKQQRINNELNSRQVLKDYKIDTPVGTDTSTAEAIVKYLYAAEGTTTVTRSSFNARVKQFLDANPGKFDKNGKRLPFKDPKTGQITTKIYETPLNVPVSPDLGQKWHGEVVKRKDIEAEIERHSNETKGSQLGRQVLKAVKGLGTRTEKLDNAMKLVNSQNIVGFLEHFPITKEGFTHVIRDEAAIEGTPKEAEYINRILTSLKIHAEHLRLDCKELDTVNSLSKTSDIDKALDKVMTRVKAYEAIPESQRREVKNNNRINDKGVNLVLDKGAENTKEASAILEAQLKNDGFFGDLYDGLKWCVGSDNCDQHIKRDINAFQQKLTGLQNVYKKDGVEAFQKQFKQEFGVDCDPILINSYTELSNKLAASAELDVLQETFRNHENWTAEQLKQNISNIPGCEKLDLTKATKPRLTKIIDDYINQVRAQKGNTLATTQTLYENTREISQKLFGHDNDVIFRASNYAESQQQGAAYLKMGVKIAGAIAAGILTGGAGLVVAATDAAAISLATDVGDAIYRNKVNGGAEMSADELIQAVKNAAIDGALFYGGGKTLKFLEGLTISKFEQIGGMMLADTAMGAGAELVRTGEITIDGVVYSAVFSMAGNGAAQLKSLKPKATANPKPAVEGTPVLKKATSNPHNPEGTAHPSEVTVGAEKRAKIADEVQQTAAKPDVTGEELADVANRVDKLVQREFRRQQEQVINDAAEVLSNSERSAYNAVKQKNLAADVENILTRGKRIQEEDVRKLTEYISTSNDVTALENLRTRLQDKSMRSGTRVDFAQTLDMTINKQIANIKLRQTSSKQLQDDVLNIMKNKGRGLDGAEHAKVMDYISKIETREQLTEFRHALQGKKLGSGNKREINNALTKLEEKFVVADKIQNAAKLNSLEAQKFIEYLPQSARENIDGLMLAGEKAGYITRNADNSINPQSVRRFLNSFDKTTYDKMMFVQNNFGDMDKAAFNKIVNLYKNTAEMVEHKPHIETWLKQKDTIRQHALAIEAEGKKMAEGAAHDIASLYGLKVPKGASKIKLEDGIELHFRGKGVESIYDKLSRKVLKGDTPINDLKQAQDLIGDLVGTRIIMDNPSPQNIQNFVNKLCNGIQDGNFKVKVIENYSNGSTRYLDDAHYNQIREAVIDAGYERELRTAGISNMNKDSKSGYVTAQFDIVHSNGAKGELQIRGKKMNDNAEIEHIPYDIRTGKNIGKNIPELEKFYEPVQDAVTMMRRNGLDNIYEKYIMKCYRYIRQFEEGKIQGEFSLPKLPAELQDYSILSLENLHNIHKQAQDIVKKAK